MYISILAIIAFGFVYTTVPVVESVIKEHIHTSSFKSASYYNDDANTHLKDLYEKHEIVKNYMNMIYFHKDKKWFGFLPMLIYTSNVDLFNKLINNTDITNDIKELIKEENITL